MLKRAVKDCGKIIKCRFTYRKKKRKNIFFLSKEKKKPQAKTKETKEGKYSIRGLNNDKKNNKRIKLCNWRLI